MPRVLRFLQTGLRKKPRVALSVALAVFAATALHTFTRPKIYEATATFVMKPREVVETAKPPDSLRCGIQCGEDINTFVKIVESTLIARRVTKHLSVSEKSRLLAIFDAPLPESDAEDKLVEALKRSRRVQKSPLGQQIEISFRHPIPDEAARIATLYASEMNTWTDQVEEDETQRALEDLQRRIEQERDELTRERQALINNRTGKDLFSPTDPLDAGKTDAANKRQELLEQLVQRYREVSIRRPDTDKHLAVIPAEVPDSPVSPHIPLHLGTGLLAGLFLGPLASALAARRESAARPT